MKRCDTPHEGKMKEVEPFKDVRFIPPFRLDFNQERIVDEIPYDRSLVRSEIETVGNTVEIFSYSRRLRDEVDEIHVGSPQCGGRTKTKGSPLGTPIELFRPGKGRNWPVVFGKCKSFSSWEDNMSLF